MGDQSQPPVHTGVEGSDDVGKGLPSDDRVLLEGMLRDIPARAVELTQSRQDVLRVDRGSTK